MANLRSARRKFTGIAIVLLVLDVAAGAWLLSPWRPSRTARMAEYEQARQQLQAKIRDSLPLRGMDKKLDVARQQIAAFYQDRLPAQYSAISAELGKVAADSGVRISQVGYETKDADVSSVRLVQINATLDADYLSAVKFINALERDKLFFILDSVTLGQEQAGRVRLQLKMETYLKTGTA